MPRDSGPLLSDGLVELPGDEVAAGVGEVEAVLGIEVAGGIAGEGGVEVDERGALLPGDVAEGGGDLGEPGVVVPVGLDRGRRCRDDRHAARGLAGGDDGADVRGGLRRVDVVAGIVRSVEDADVAGAAGKAGQDQEDEKLRMKYLNLNWQDLQAVSDDIIGWIRLPKTVINYPIVQGSDNDFYLTHTASGEWSNNGAIFADANDPDPLGGFLTILYGHRMRDWSMFGSIGDYFDDHGDSDYFQQHPVWQVYTPDKTYDLEIFGAAEVHSENTDIYRFYFADEDDRQSYIDWILAHNELQGYDGRVSVTPDDKLVMLSTCTLASNEYRLVIWGKLTEVEVPKP